MVKIYAEGGGRHYRKLRKEMAQGFHAFFHKAGLTGKMPKVIPCGGRKSAYDKGRHSFKILAEIDPHKVMLAPAAYARELIEKLK